jgi:diguanylate cyclase (GGDEF)-like protein
MDEILTDVVSRASHRGATLAVLVIRLFGFDSIKDNFGHVVGDRALRAFAARLQGSARANDMYGRHDDNGGFIYILDQDPKSQTVIMLCDKLARELTFDLNIETARIRLRPTIGGSRFPADGSTVEQIVQAALDAQSDAQTRGIPVALTASFQSDGKGAEELNSGEGNAAAPGVPAPDNGVGERVVDRRSERRQRVLQRGQIRAAGHGSAVDCTIRDLSAAGARLRVDAFYAVPDEFELYFTRSGSRRQARVRWQIGNDIGVQFIDTAGLARLIQDGLEERVAGVA